MIKKIILFFIFIFFFSEFSLAKIEKTNIGFTIDIPPDLVLVNRKNYEEVKKIVNYIPERKKIVVPNSKIQSIENDDDKVEQYLRLYEIGEYIMFGLIPVPPKNYLFHNITFSKFDKIDFNRVINDKQFLKNICQDFLKQVHDKGSSMTNVKIGSCKIDKDKFKNFSQTIKMTFDLSKIPNLSKIAPNGLMYEGYFFNFNNYTVTVELFSEKQNYHILDNHLTNIVNSIK
jgi:MoaA/NifB/PqqE/SkfB family radical SAM enzyme